MRCLLNLPFVTVTTRPGVMHPSHLGEQHHHRHACHRQPEEINPLSRLKQSCQALTKPIDADHRSYEEQQHLRSPPMVHTPHRTAVSLLFVHSPPPTPAMLPPNRSLNSGFSSSPG